ncbi:hypothetical protein DYJ25_03430 [Prevotella denticola]|nr:hypothetical protein DYJ25_03430 [Prevotella denticola]
MNKSFQHTAFTDYKLLPFRQYTAGSGPSTRLVFTDNSISDGHQHICREREDRFIPAALIYSKVPMNNLY